MQADTVGEGHVVEQGQGQQSTRRLADHADARGHGHRLASAAEFRHARILRLQHCGGTQIHARGPVEPIATWQDRTSNPRIITCVT